MKITTEMIRKLRKRTKTSIVDCREALEKSGGDTAVAVKYLREKGAEILQKKKNRQTKNGIIASYIHPDKKIGVIVELACETDFVSRTEDFHHLAHELTLQIAATDPQNIETLLAQPYIKDESLTIFDLIKTAISKLKENIKIVRFCRYQI